MAVCLSKFLLDMNISYQYVQLMNNCTSHLVVEL